jgi:predicted amidohydrolase
MRVTLAQIAPKLNRSNLGDIVEIVKGEITKKSELIVFPELSLSGYMLQDKLSEDAWSLDQLSVLEELSKDIDIVVGGAMQEENSFRNAALCFSEGELLSEHHKVHLPNYGMFEEARYFRSGDLFESFLLKGRRVAMVVCEDLWHKNVHHDLMEQNPDLIVALVASPARGFCDDGLEIETKWYEIIQTVAKECEATLLFVNRVGFEDGLGFWGGSCIVNASGNIVEKVEKFKIKIETFEVKI